MAFIFHIAVALQVIALGFAFTIMKDSIQNTSDKILKKAGIIVSGLMLVLMSAALVCTLSLWLYSQFNPAAHDKYFKSLVQDSTGEEGLLFMRGLNGFASAPAPAYADTTTGCRRPSTHQGSMKVY